MRLSKDLPLNTAPYNPNVGHAWIERLPELIQALPIAEPPMISVLNAMANGRTGKPMIPMGRPNYCANDTDEHHCLRPLWRLHLRSGRTMFLCDDCRESLSSLLFIPDEETK